MILESVDRYVQKKYFGMGRLSYVQEKITNAGTGGSERTLIEGCRGSHGGWLTLERTE